MPMRAMVKSFEASTHRQSDMTLVIIEKKVNELNLIICVGVVFMSNYSVDAV